jgi:hypothetical protein
MLRNRSHPDRYYRRLLKGLLITAGFVVLLLGILHLWFVHNARGVLRDLVATESGGKLKLELKQLSFDLQDNKIQLRNAQLFSTDTLTQSVTYSVKFRKLTLRVASFWPLVLEKKLLLDSIKLHDPDITISQWRRDTLVKSNKDELSLPQEMGKLYNSMLDALDGFGIRRIIINNATVRLVNKMKRGTEPVVLSRIYFDLMRAPERGGRRDAFLANAQTVDLSTTNQNIALPGGRHRLAFKSFRLELFRKRIVLDSCTLTANATDSTKSNYTIFFKRLLLVGVDFGSMYRNNTVRADSVYCEDPNFRIDINTLAGAGNGDQKSRPDPEKIIRELTGDLDLAFVGVKDAGFSIRIRGRQERRLFNSNKDDFEVRGLRIDGGAEKPITVQRFDMMVRDYHLYSRDSSVAYTFDSIHFINNRILLSNLAMLSTPSGAAQRALYDLKVPHFELTGLDWHALLFDQSLVAEEAALYNPVIEYTAPGKAGKVRKGTLSASLGALDQLIALRRLQLSNGQVHVHLGNGTHLQFGDVNLRMRNIDLLRGGSRRDLRHAVEALSMASGSVRQKGLEATFTNARYTGKRLLQADALEISSRDRSVAAHFAGIAIDDVVLDEDRGRLLVDGLHWNRADIALRMPEGKAGSKSSGNLELRNISAQQTSLQLTKGNLTLHTFLESVRLRSFARSGSAAPRMEGVGIIGRQLSVQGSALNASAGRYRVSSDGGSEISDFRFQQYGNSDSLSVQVPTVRFRADLNSLLGKETRLSSVDLQAPVLRMVKRSIDEGAPSKPFRGKLRIDRLHLQGPDAVATKYARDSISEIRTLPLEESELTLSGLSLDGANLRLDGLQAALGNVTYMKTGSEKMGIEKGSLHLDLADMELSKNAGKASWSGLIRSLELKNPNPVTLGRGRLSTERIALGNVRLSSGSVSDFDALLKFNVSAWLQTATGEFTDSNTTLRWYNASYNSGSRLLSLDSFSYNPTRSLDSVLAQTPYQVDYITFHSGAVRLTDFNLERYRKDSSILGNTLSIQKPLITIYRDKSVPFRAGKEKLMPADLITSIPVAIGLQQVQLTDGELRYTEKNGKSGAEGTLLLARLQATLSQISNRNHGPADSLGFTLNAWLMDSAQLDLRVRQSYSDPMGGFLMTLRMKPTSLSFLNPVLAPLSNVIIRSGIIDSMDVRATGSNEVTLGTMNMWYHDLRIRLVKAGDENRSTVLGNMASFLANTFVIRKNNTGRPGYVYFERDRERSFFNYLIRMTFSGMATSVGVKKNGSYRKRYTAFARKKGLPAQEFK